MSDNIKNLPINEYSNPTLDEINVMNSLFNTSSQPLDLRQAKISIIITLLYIILFLTYRNNNFTLKSFISISSICFLICVYFTQQYIS